jgi:hypothetical protein
MRLPRLVPLRFALPLLALWAATASAAETVRLKRWEEPARPTPTLAPGIAYYQLFARAEWPRGAAAEAEHRYNLHVILPGGQTETHEIPAGEINAGRLSVLVPVAVVRNLVPSQVVIWANVSDAATGEVVSNELEATIADFPHPQLTSAANDAGPFGWGMPLTPSPGGADLLPRPGPDGLVFVRVFATDAMPGYGIASTEASNAQVGRRLPGYDPRAGRSDEFTLEDPAQPALGLSPARAQEYLAALGKADPSGLTYRLPAQAEWLRTARAGKGSAFWWGDESSYPAGANFLGPEPALDKDSTAPALSVERAGATVFELNPWGLYHTFGNVAEWATTPAGGFVRLGGHFRTEPAVPLPEITVDDAATVGPDPYVGVRPAFGLTADEGAELVRKALAGNTLLAGISVAYDPDRATATLSGTLPDAALRRAADRRLEPLWFLAAVENRIETPRQVPGQLATLAGAVGPVRRITPLGRWIYVVPLSVSWGDPLPVRGSEWYVNVYPQGARSCTGHYAYKLVEIEPNATGRLDLLLDRAKLTAAGVSVGTPVAVALSLGAPAPAPDDTHVVSNVATITWSVP